LSEFGFFNAEAGELLTAGIDGGLVFVADDLFVCARQLGLSVVPLIVIGDGANDEPLRVQPRRAQVGLEGPERAGARMALSLMRRGESGAGYVGDGLFEVSVLADQLVMLGVGLRLHPTDGVSSLRSAGISLRAPGIESVSGAGGPVCGQASFSEVGDWIIFRTGESWGGLYWGSDSKGWCDPLGGEGLWPRIGDGKTAPFFHGWENYLRQSHEPRGWRARETAGFVVEDESITLAWHQLSDLPVEDTKNFSGALALCWGESEAEVRVKMEALASPLTPAAEGAAVSGFDYLEGSYRFRRTGESCKITLPADPLARSTVVRVDGPPAAAVSCSVNGERVRPQLVSVGRVDDPYGPHEGRPDSSGRPIIAQFEKPGERVELGVQLSKDAPTVIEVGERQGVSLSYLAQDDRRELLLFSHLDQRPLGRLSLADLKLRDLRLPGRARATMSVLPLYWFLMNAPSRFHSANLLESWDISTNGPDEIKLSLSALNPGEKVRSTVSLRLPAPTAGLLKLEVCCKLEVLEKFSVPHFQFCNLFPEHSRQPEDWQHAETLAMTREQLWVVENRKSSGDASTAAGERFRDHTAPFFLSQYAAPGGNFALLVNSVSPAEQQLGYELCRCWLDNHLFMTFPEGGPEVGASYEVSYELALWGDGNTSREEVRGLAEASVASGRLEL
jgi:hypothetical protein